MKKIILLVCLLALVSCGRENFNEKEEVPPVSKTEVSEEASVPESTLESEEAPLISQKEEESEKPQAAPEKEETVPQEEESYEAPAKQSEDWRLILVNPWNYIPDDFTVELDYVDGYPVDKRIKEPLINMIEGAKQDGVDLLVCYGYRTKEQSQQLFEKQINRQIASGLSYDDAVEEAKKWVAPPGTSEHHTGLALDIVTPAYQMLTYEFANTDAAVWMRENAHRYGFILRYPEDKEEITGITFEPWHYRYVGPEAAGYIYENGLCLEEFLKGDNVN